MTFYCYLCATDVTTDRASWGSVWSHIRTAHGEVWAQMPKWPDGLPVVHSEPGEWLQRWADGRAPPIDLRLRPVDE